MQMHLQQTSRARRAALDSPISMRMTRQRRAILTALERARRPLRPDEIAAYAESDAAGISLATQPL